MLPTPEILYKIQQDSFSFESIWKAFHDDTAKHIDACISACINLEHKWVTTALTREGHMPDCMQLKNLCDILEHYTMERSKIKMEGIDFDYFVLKDKSGKTIDVLMYGIDYKNNCIKYTSLFHLESQQNDPRS